MKRAEFIMPKIEYVSIGKDYNSKERAELKITELLNQGYTKTHGNGSRLTFKK